MKGYCRFGVVQLDVDEIPESTVSWYSTRENALKDATARAEKNPGLVCRIVVANEYVTSKSVITTRVVVEKYDE